MGKSVSRLSGGAMRWQLLLASAAAVLLAGCSGSVERFSENYSNPSDSDPVYTASIPKAKTSYTAPAYKAPQVADNSNGIVENPIASQPIAQQPAPDYTKSYAGTYSQQAAKQVPAYPQPKYAYNAPTAQPEAPAYQKPTYKQPVIDDTQAAADEQIVPAKKPAALPFKKAEVTPPAKPKAVAAAETIEPTAAPAKAGGAKSYTVAQGDTLFSIGRKYNVSPFAIADANRLPHDKQLPVGKTINIPSTGTQTAAAAPAIKADSKIKPLAADDATGQEDISANTKGDGQAVAQAEAPQAKPTAVAAAPAATGDGPLAMRWPVRGKVISPFGPKTGGMKNEGINISVPEGTNVQAAEGGVVAYAGNELKGYGNLVLIRHAGGYVTAYAHNSSIIVKKGDTVKRGDLIAKSGATGAVQSPQLHFEVRKGATALDPSTFLNSASASN